MTDHSKASSAASPQAFPGAEPAVAAALSRPLPDPLPPLPEPVPVSRAALFAYFDALGLAHETVDHVPVFTVEEAEAARLDARIAGAHTKNLFVKDKKDRYFLITLEERASVNLKTVHETIGARGRVSFGSAERLMQHLGVVPGSVTLLAAINDRAGSVTVVIDEALLAHETINMHPLSNDATTSLSRADLLAFLEAVGHPPLVLKVSE